MNRVITVWLAFLLVSACDNGADNGEYSTDDNGDDTGDDNAEDGDAGSVCYADEPGYGPQDETDSIQRTWGAPCTTNEECQELIGDSEAICDTTAVIYELPGGYCTKPCQLPDAETGAVADDPNCDPNGGVHCIGALGFFERCAVECTANEQCHRDGYACRQMPMIAKPEDPTFCLMSECCEGCCSTDGCPTD